MKGAARLQRLIRFSFLITALFEVKVGSEFFFASLCFAGWEVLQTLCATLSFTAAAALVDEWQYRPEWEWCKDGSSRRWILFRRVLMEHTRSLARTRLAACF